MASFKYFFILSVPELFSKCLNSATVNFLQLSIARLFSIYFNNQKIFFLESCTDRRMSYARIKFCR